MTDDTTSDASRHETTSTERYSMDRAKRHGHLVVWGNGCEVTGDCEALSTGERCFSFSTYSTQDALDRAFIEHAAETEGVCWTCSQVEDGWVNRDECDRCWLMWNAHNGVLPRDAGTRPSRRSPDSGDT